MRLCAVYLSKLELTDLIGRGRRLLILIGLTAIALLYS